ncbi:Protein F15G9.5 [Aphelenchoides avenae]|nr:Protein F15G9.5 [Aphelenchus avenae]
MPRRVHSPPLPPPSLLLMVALVANVCVTPLTAAFGVLPGADAAEPGCVNGEVCSRNSAQVCRNNTCISACSLRGMKECVCDTEEDNYCYLCCGSDNHRCMPAHQHNILRPNGERWERENCGRCRRNGLEMEGLACDDLDPQRLCLQGKCSKSVCHDKQQGEFCDRKLEKICNEDICENPCARYAPHLMVCDCPIIDPDTGFASDDRCQLCCYDFNVVRETYHSYVRLNKVHYARPRGTLGNS